MKVINFKEPLEEFEKSVATLITAPPTTAGNTLNYSNKYELIEYVTKAFGSTTLFKLLKDTIGLDLSGVKSDIIIPITCIVSVMSPKLVKIEYSGCFKEAPDILKLLKYSDSLKEISLNYMGYHYDLNPKILKEIVGFSHPININLGQMGLSSEDEDDIPNAVKNYNEGIKKIKATIEERPNEIFEAIKFTGDVRDIFKLVDLIGEYEVPNGETILAMPDYTHLGLC